jgi:cytochrome c-type biogenesis protein CcmH/NrfG
MWRWLIFLLLLGAGAATRPANALLDRARELAVKGDHAGAIEKYRQVLAKEDLPEAHAGLAASYLAMGKLDQADEEIGQALKAAPGEATYWMLRGRVNLAESRLDEAEGSYRNAAGVVPKRAGEIWADLASALAGLKDEKLGPRVESALKLAAAADPPSAEALFTLGQSYAKAGKEEGKTYLKKYLEIQSALPEEKRDYQKMQLARQMIRAIDILKSIGREK